MAAKFLNDFKQRIEEVKLVPAGGGCFEVTFDGELVYSKLKTGTFPDEGDMVDTLATRLRSSAH